MGQEETHVRNIFCEQKQRDRLGGLSLTHYPNRPAFNRAYPRAFSTHVHGVRWHVSDDHGPRLSDARLSRGLPLCGICCFPMMLGCLIVMVGGLLVVLVDFVIIHLSLPVGGSAQIKNL
jgi:hypothetical protein